MKGREAENLSSLKSGSMRMGCVMMATVCRSFLFPFRFVRESLGITWRFDGMIPSPGPPFLNREAATMLPALLRRAAATGVILTGEGDALVFETRGGQRHADAAHEKG
jgi:hypothetical protein